MKSFNYNGSTFLLDGNPFTINSGAIHYFRIPKEYWKDRLIKLKECGFNCVETYIAWNLMEPKEGRFSTENERDISEFLSVSQELGLYAIVRPGPYICAEWEFGGLPAWLLKYTDIKFRCDNRRYMSAVKRYLTRLIDVLRPHLYENGGNVLALQVENEYGSWGNDKKYLKKLTEIYRENCPETVLFTADGAELFMVRNGMAEGCISTLTFGSCPEKNMRILENSGVKGPKMCAEFWCGWFDHWYAEHHVRTAADLADNFEPFLKHNWNVNFYMFCGGTNFGFMNGANNNKYAPTVTSYDYNALLTEAGDRTEAYYKVRQLFIKYGYSVPELTAKESIKRSYGEVEFTACALLFDHLPEIGKMYRNTTPLHMEEMGQNYGYVLYSVTVENAFDLYKQNGEYPSLFLDRLADRANIFIDGVYVKTLERGVNEYDGVKIVSDKNTNIIDILVENMGRINYGRGLSEDRKGIDAAYIYNKYLYGWVNVSLPMDNLGKLKFDEEVKPMKNLPVFYKGRFYVDEVADTFLKTDGFGKGFVMVNGKNLGRYYTKAGPTKTLYVPAVFLHKGENEIIVFDSDGAASLSAEFIDHPLL